MSAVRKRSISQWLLFLWIGAVYLAEWWGGNELLKRFRLDLWTLFILFTALHLSLCWISLTPKLHRLWLICYFAGQGMILLLITFMLRIGSPLVIALYLMVIEEVVIVFQRRRSAAALAVGYLLLPVVIIGLRALGVLPSVGVLPLVGDHASWSLLVLPVFLLLPLIPFVVGYLQASARERDQSLLRELEVAHSQLAAYALRVEELTRVTERQRLARELHDTLAQGLAGLILQLEVANSHLKQSQNARGQEIVQQAIVRARTALVDARCAIDNLRLDVTCPDDLPVVVTERAEHFTTATGIPCDLDLAALTQTPTSLCEQVLRVISEALENVARHAQAQRVGVRALVEKTALTVEIHDDGCGFDPTAIGRQTGHYGLLGLRERARLIGGTLEVVSAKGEGTTLRLSLLTGEPQQSALPAWLRRGGTEAGR